MWIPLFLAMGAGLSTTIGSLNAFGSEHMPIVGVMAGMAVMMISLWLLK